MLAIPAPMRATEGGKPFTDPAWIYEIKYDGYRVMGARRRHPVDRAAHEERRGAAGAAQGPDDRRGGPKNDSLGRNSRTRESESRRSRPLWDGSPKGSRKWRSISRCWTIPPPMRATEGGRPFTESVPAGRKPAPGGRDADRCNRRRRRGLCAWRAGSSQTKCGRIQTKCWLPVHRAQGQRCSNRPGSSRRQRRHHPVRRQWHPACHLPPRPPGRPQPRL